MKREGVVITLATQPSFVVAVALASTGIALSSGETPALFGTGSLLTALGAVAAMTSVIVTVRRIRAGASLVRGGGSVALLAIAVGVPLLLGASLVSSSAASLAAAIIPLGFLAGYASRLDDRPRLAASVSTGSAAALSITVVLASRDWISVLIQGAVVGFVLLVVLYFALMLAGRAANPRV